MYLDAILNREEVDLGDPPKSYKATLLGEENRGDDSEDEDLPWENEMGSDVSKFDFSGFVVVRELDGDRPCPTLIILEEEERRLCKPWRKMLVIKLLGRGIRFQALESKLHQFWVRDSILNISISQMISIW